MTKVIQITASVLTKSPLPSLGADSDKNTRGRVLVVAGSKQVPGAAALCGEAALRAGAGKLQLVGTAAYAQALAFAVPEARVVETTATERGDVSPDASQAIAPLLEKNDAVVIGPGMMDEVAAGLLAQNLLRGAPPLPFLIDAGAMAGLKGCADVKDLSAGRVVLTPHGGELAALLDVPADKIKADPLIYAGMASQRFNAVVVLKGQDTYIVTPKEHAWCNEGGVSGLGTCGSGDVLAGVIGGLLARGAKPSIAAIWGVYLHARAGQRLAVEVGPLGFLARELPPQIPRCLAELQCG